MINFESIEKLLLENYSIKEIKAWFNPYAGNDHEVPNKMLGNFYNFNRDT